MNITVEHIFISPAHKYVGHHGGPPGNPPAVSMPAVRLIAGRGIEGDRYALRDAGHPRQITFFDMAVLDELSRRFTRAVPPGAVRRNVLVRGCSLPELVGRRFRVQGVLFEGMDPCKPCYWMDEAIGPGAEELLKGRGGLRARILEDGRLHVGAAILAVEERT
jgi:MOSC domain-containing protein YiiM